MKTKANTKRIGTWPILVLLLPAFVAIWGGWVGLGEMTGFGLINLLPGMGTDALPAELGQGAKGFRWAVVNTAITLPIGLETYAAYALHVFIQVQSRPGFLRTFAGVSALCSLILGMSGQVAYHVMESMKITEAPIWVTAIVGSLPVAVLGLGTTLGALIRRAEAQEEPGETGPRRTLADRVASVRTVVTETLDAVKVPTVPAPDPIGAVPAPHLSEVPLGPEVPPVVDTVPTPETPVRTRRVPAQRGSWDVEKAVQLLLEGGRRDEEVAALVGVGAKMIQRTRRAVAEIKADPHTEIPAAWKVPGHVVEIIRREVPKW